MLFRLQLLFCVLLLVGAGCFAAFGCYDSDPAYDEDWGKFHEVYSGPGPDDDSEDLLFKLNFDRYNNVTGETEGPFFARISGDYVDGPEGTHLTFEARFGSNGCEGVTDVEFTGNIREEELTGRIFYNGCQVYDFYYEGIRVGGFGR